MSDEPTEMIQRVRRHLDAGVNTLDPSLVDRLHKARRRALVQGQRAGPHQGRYWFVPAGAVAACALAAVIWFVTPQPLPKELLAMDAELELIGEPEGLDLVDDLDFYLWLEQQDSVDG